MGIDGERSFLARPPKIEGGSKMSDQCRRSRRKRNMQLLSDPSRGQSDGRAIYLRQDSSCASCGPCLPLYLCTAIGHKDLNITWTNRSHRTLALASTG